MSANIQRRQLYLCPRGLTSSQAEGAINLAGGWCGTHQLHARVAGVGTPEIFAGSPEEVALWAAQRGMGGAYNLAFERLTKPRTDFAGIPMDRPGIMAIINVTPDSFSDGGDHFDAKVAVENGLAMWEAGAVLLDVGGESTRPGADPVSEQEELDRVLPVVEELAKAGARVSIDSRRAVVQRAALDAGAAVVNDVTALTGDPQSLSLVAERQVPVIMMHMLGTPQTMQQDPRYDNVVYDIHDYLSNRISNCVAEGIALDKIAVDPGIGFGKTVKHNLALLNNLEAFHDLGVCLLLGASRKSFIGKLSRGEAPKERVAGSLAAALAGVQRGVQLLRVHDVAETRQALELWMAIQQSDRD